jgi:drug/metabolite transporter (DMT)-like permease
MAPRIAVLTALALIAFAANSILCRLALTETTIDPLAFVALRLGSGAVAMAFLLRLRRRSLPVGIDWQGQGSWLGAAALFGYALAFSLAYTAIPTGTGALLLFGTIQVALIVYGFAIGERLSWLQSLGFLCAIGGLVTLMLPSLGAPPMLFGGLMVLSGLSWAVYTLVGRRASHAMAATTGNFIRATPMGLLVLLGWVVYSAMETPLTSLGLTDLGGVAAALLSGAVASGVGYMLWYSVLKELPVTQVATLQLSVPVIATFGGVVLLGETVSLVLIGASAAILLGIALVVVPVTKRL